MTRSPPTAIPTAMPEAPTSTRLPVGLEPRGRASDRTLARLPRLRLEVHDLSNDGAKSFLSLINALETLSTAIHESFRLLYHESSVAPPVRSVTLILRAFPGVAHTKGLELDDDHKEIHLSTDYIQSIPADRFKDEVVGVICHEMVHCWQWNGKGSCPGGLVEGVADYVRLKCGHGPPHWERKWKDCSWDSGYEKTAYFLEYLECRFGAGTVVKINERLRDREYEEKAFWDHCCGSDIDTLWKDYCDSCDRKFGAELKN